LESQRKSISSGYELEDEIRQCKVIGCDRNYFAKGYCRYHYIKNWKRIKIMERLRSEAALDDHITNLIDKYPDEYMDMLREDIKKYEGLEEEDVEGIIDEFLNQEEEET